MTEEKEHPFNPRPLNDAWSTWLVGSWEGAGESDTGQGRGVLSIEPALGGQFLICRGQAEITGMTEEQMCYLRSNMHASDEEIERFKRSGYESLEIYTIDPITGDVIGHLFDNLRCIATGKGRREADKEVVDWEWLSGHKSTRITEKVDDDRILIIERTPMPDGSVMEDRGEMTRRR